MSARAIDCFSSSKHQIQIAKQTRREKKVMSNSEMDQAVKDWIARLRNSNNVQCRIEKPGTKPVYSLEKLPEEARERIKSHRTGIFTEDGTQFDMKIRYDSNSVLFDIYASHDSNCEWHLDKEKGQKLGSYDLPFGYLLVFFLFLDYLIQN